MDSIPLKRCSKCKQEWPATSEYFRPRLNRPRGWDSQCKPCRKAEYRLKHPPKSKEQLPDGYKRCTKCSTILPATTEFFYPSKKYGMEWYCKTCARARSRKPRKSPLPPPGFRVCTVCHEMKPATLEYFRKSVRRVGLDARCKVCRSETRKRYFREHPEQHVKNVTRRMGYQEIPGIITSQQIQAKLKAQKYTCYYCFVKFEKRKDGTYIYHLEHTIPISRTEFEPRHDVNYVVLACHTCNESKRNRLPHEWPRGGRLM